MGTHPDSYFDDAENGSPNVLRIRSRFLDYLESRSLNEASAQFRSALDSKRERAMVREIRRGSIQ
jgi:hypothetical protein